MADTPERPTGGITPFLSIGGGRASEALAFYQAAFGAVVVERNLAQDGKRLLQASARINGGWIMLSDDFPEMGHTVPVPGAVTLHLQVDDADAWWRRALEAGAVATMEIGDQFWGDRYGQLRDPFGHSWSVGSPIKG
ncbi:MAG: glyoxalase/bleomycin resistance/extradiol dioxygenase family protein [Caulobacteraceae bacterium]|nr:glyoxalase/bleomycin resistance/extradiol dioxygenase family protein [Caulobacteraceae bacterium]